MAKKRLKKHVHRAMKRRLKGCKKASNATKPKKIASEIKEKKEK